MNKVILVILAVFISWAIPACNKSTQKSPSSPIPAGYEALFKPSMPTKLEEKIYQGDWMYLRDALFDEKLTNMLYKKDVKGRTIFHYALMAISNQYEIFEQLDSVYKIPDAAFYQDNDGNTPLHYEALLDKSRSLYGTSSIIKLFGEQFNAVKNKKGQTPLQLGIAENLKGMPRELIQNIDDLKIKTPAGKELWEVLAENAPRSLIYAIDKIAEDTYGPNEELLTLKNPEGETILHLAARYDDYALAKEFLERAVRNTSRNTFLSLAPDTKGRHPVITASLNDSAAMLEAIYQYFNYPQGIGDDLNFENSTPLGLAIKSKHPYTALYLVQSKMCSLNATNSSGEPYFKKTLQITNDTELAAMSPEMTLLYVYYPFEVCQGVSLKLRTNPINGDVVTTLKAKDPVRIIDVPEGSTTNIGNRDGVWVRVDANGQRGYVFSGFLQDTRLPEFQLVYDKLMMEVSGKGDTRYEPGFFETVLQNDEWRRTEATLKVELFLYDRHLWPTWFRQYQDIQQYPIRKAVMTDQGLKLSDSLNPECNWMLIDEDMASYSSRPEDSYSSFVNKQNYPRYQYNGPE